MNILFVTAEAAPFAKVGGLGDVVAAGSLPTALQKQGTDARVLLPLYGTIDREKYGIEPIFSFEFSRRTDNVYVTVHHTVWHDVPFYFVEAYPFFSGEDTVYTDWNWDMPRFIFFSQVVLAVVWELRQRDGWTPDVLHVNDWHTGLVPFLLYQSRYKPEWAQMRSMMTIHNMAHQGNNAGGWLWDLGMPGRDHPALRNMGLGNNLLAIGIAYADYVTTVSPRHADEIQYASLGYGLSGLVKSRTYENRLYGILNGIDTEKFNPETDPQIVQNYTADDFADARAENKRRLQAYAGLEVDENIPLIGIVSRLVWQKGIDIAVPAVRRLLGERRAQFIALGTGDPNLSGQLWQLQQDYPHRARSIIAYDAAVAQRIYSAADVFLMPSRYEPCGIGQMLAMRYGSLPIVRETGGLADTVENYDNKNGETGTGFVFLWEEPEAVLNTLHWALDTYEQQPGVWQRMQQRAMQKDFSWRRSAHIYNDRYKEIVP